MEAMCNVHMFCPLAEAVLDKNHPIEKKDPEFIPNWLNFRFSLSRFLSIFMYCVYSCWFVGLLVGFMLRSRSLPKRWLNLLNKKPFCHLHIYTNIYNLLKLCIFIGRMVKIREQHKRFSEFY